MVAKLFMLGMCVFLNQVEYNKYADVLMLKHDFNKSDWWGVDRFNFVFAWDGLYFLNAIRKGYMHVKNYAFYPGMPLLLTFLDSAASKLIPFYARLREDPSSLLLLGYVGCLLNFALHFASNVLLFKLARLRGLTMQASRRIGYLFALMGTGFYHTVFYSESLYFFVVLYGLYRLELLYARHVSLSQLPLQPFLLLTLLLSLSGFLRSVGLLNGAFLGYPLLLEFVKYLRLREFKQCVNILFRMAMVIAMFIIPTVKLFIETRSKFCTDGGNPEYLLPDFCLSKYGFFYDFIQKKFWSVEFLSEWKNGQCWLYLVVLNTYPVVYFAFKRFFRENRLKDLLTLNIPLYLQSDTLNEPRIRQLPDFVILLITLRTYYFYANQNSVERLLTSNYFYFFLMNSFQEERNKKSHTGLASWVLNWVLKTLLFGNCLVRIFLTPYFFVTRLYPI